MAQNELDPRTGRPFGDHGTAVQALNFALYHMKDEDGGYPVNDDDRMMFLREWFEGAAADEFPEFYTWLKEQEA